MSVSFSSVEAHLLWRTKVALLVIALLCVVAGRSDYLWPFMTWTMYSTMPDAQRDRFNVRALADASGDREDEPSPTGRTSAVELRAISEEGQAHTVALSNGEPAAGDPQSRPLFEVGRRTVAEGVVELAFARRDDEQREAHRAYLARVVTSVLPELEIARIQGWRKVWAVDPLAVPPLTRDRPSRVVFLGAFSPATYGADR